MIGFTSVSLRKYTIEEVVAAAVKSRADYIEWGSDVHIKTPEEAAAAKELCDNYGIKVRAYGTYYHIGCFDGEQWDNICECAGILGAEYIRTWLGEKGSADTSEGEYLRIIEDSRICCEKAAKYGLTVSNECHHHTFNDLTESSLKYLKDANCGNLKTYYQSWYRDEKGDTEKLIKLLPFVSDVHLSFSEMDKFQAGYTRDEKFIEKILRKLKSLDFSGGLTLEFTKDDKSENLVEDMKKLRKMWEAEL